MSFNQTDKKFWMRDKLSSALSTCLLLNQVTTVCDDLDEPFWSHTIPTNSSLQDDSWQKRNCGTRCSLQLHKTCKRLSWSLQWESWCGITEHWKMLNNDLVKTTWKEKVKPFNFLLNIFLPLLSLPNPHHLSLPPVTCSNILLSFPKKLFKKNSPLPSQPLLVACDEQRYTLSSSLHKRCRGRGGCKQRGRW